VLESVVQLRFQVSQESIGRACGVGLKVVEELVRQVRVLGQLVVQILHSLLPHLVLLLDIVLHVVRLVLDFLNHFLLLGDTEFLFLDEAVLNSFELAADWIQVIIVVFNAVLSLLVYSALTLVHPCMILRPLLSEYLSFFIHLTLQVVAQLLQFILELLLELINHIMHVVHGRNRELLVLPDLIVGVIELLLHLALVLDTGILEHLEGGAHVLHLRLESCQVLVLSVFLIYHFKLYLNLFGIIIISYKLI